jgi:glycosyltransferase involved in cell wall biosynthesis
MTPAAGAGRRVLVLEPYFGGSHRAVLEALLPRLADAGWAADTLTLPARKWKWRMRGAAITMAGEARALDLEWRAAHPAGELARPGARARWDLVYASTFVNLAEFVALAGDAVAGVPRIVYFHENQLLYPNRHSAEWDFQFPLTNITSALTADACLFNTRWNMDGFLREIVSFMREFPDHRPAGVAEAIAAKSSVLPPPFDPAPFDEALGGAGVANAPRGPRCRIVWPHRWEHDKDPETFFAACSALAGEGLDFEVAVAGQAFAETKGAFERAGAALGDRLVHIGEPGSRADYAALLAGSDVAVSTACNEFFGLAIIEAAYSGCFPLVPDRLAYPELYPPGMRYPDSDELVARLRSLLLERPAPGQARALAERFTADRLAPEYSEAFERAVQGREARRG